MEAVFFQSQQRTSETGMVSFHFLRPMSYACCLRICAKMFSCRNCSLCAVLAGRFFNNEEMRLRYIHRLLVAWNTVLARTLASKIPYHSDGVDGFEYSRFPEA